MPDTPTRTWFGRRLPPEGHAFPVAPGVASLKREEQVRSQVIVVALQSLVPDFG